MKETLVETDSQHERLAALLRERTAWRGPSPELDQIVRDAFESLRRFNDSLN